MAKIRPIKGLDSDIENIALNKAETIIIRDEAIDKVEVLSLQEKIYTGIKRITMALGFSVKEVEFCKRMIDECDEISQKDFPKEELENIEKDKRDYIQRQNDANKKIIDKAIDLNEELENLEELKNNKSKYLTEDVLTSIDRIIKEINEFKKALEIDDIENSEIYTEVQNANEVDDFVDLEAFLGSSNKEEEVSLFEDELPEPKVNDLPVFEDSTEEESTETLDFEVTGNMFDN